MTIEVVERMSCTADETVDLARVVGKEHPLRKGFIAVNARWVKVDWSDNTATVVIRYEKP